MKRRLLISVATLLIGTAACAYAQAQEPPQQNPQQVFYGRGWGRWAAVGQVTGQVSGQVPTLYGRGRGGVPYAWNDRNMDGICDLTGQSVGQRPIGFGGGRGRWAAVRQVTGQVPPVYGRGRGRGGGGRGWR